MLAYVADVEASRRSDGSVHGRVRPAQWSRVIHN